MKTLVKLFNKKGQRVIIGYLDVNGTLWVDRAALPAGTYSCVGYAYQRIPRRLKKRFKIQDPRYNGKGKMKAAGETSSWI
ncbi:hypothetical protein MKC73_01200 [[Clostridium] innocuum]|nr:hypothetical protein [[Clostridium] innocuum]